MDDLNQLQKEKTDLQERVRQLKKDSLKVWIKPIIVFPISILVIPFFPSRGGESLATLMGTAESILLTGGFFSFVFIWSAIVKFNEYKAEKFDIEWEIELIDSRIDRFKLTSK